MGAGIVGVSHGVQLIITCFSCSGSSRENKVTAFEKARAVNPGSQAPLHTSEPESISELDPRVIDSLASE